MYDYAYVASSRKQGAVKQHARLAKVRTLGLGVGVLLLCGVGGWMLFSGSPAKTALPSVPEPSAAPPSMQASAQKPEPSLAVTQRAAPTQVDEQPNNRPLSVLPQPVDKISQVLLPSKPAPSANETLPTLPSIKEDYAFYALLNRPALKHSIGPELWKSERIYRVKTALLDSRSYALSLRAQLYFQGYSRVDVVTESFRQQPVYRVVIEEVDSRSKMNQLLDFFADKGIQAVYSYTKVE